MSYYTINLAANKPVVMTVAGTVILIDDLGAAPGLDITPSYGGRDLPKMPNRKKAFKFSEPFDAVTLVASVDCTVALFLSKNDVDLGFADGSLVNVSGEVTVTNNAGARVPVDIGGGNVNVNAVNVGINNDNASAVPVKSQTLASVVDFASVTLNNLNPTALIADPTLYRLRIRNASATAHIGIGGAGLTMANAAIVLLPGETWVEEDAAGASWYVVTNEVGATINMQGLKP